MKLSKGWKIAVGISTLLVAVLPLFLVFVFMLFPLFMMSTVRGNEPDPAFLGIFFLIFPLFFLVGFLQIGLMIFYHIHNIKNRDGSETIRILLGLGNYFLPYFSMPAYFFIYIWPEKAPEWALQEAPKRRTKTRS